MANDKPVGVAFADPALVTGWTINGVAVTASAAELNTNTGVVAGTATASKALVLDANKRAATLGAFTWGEGNIYFGVTSITAHAGGGQGSATALTGEYNLITVSATAGDSVVLPAGALGKPMRVKLSAAAAASANLYPPTGGTVNGLAANTPVVLTPGTDLLFWATSATAWHCEGGVNAAAGFTLAPNNVHTLASKPLATSDGAEYTVVATEVIVAETQVLANVIATGVALFNASAVAGNVKVGLCDSTGAVIATSVSTAQAGTDAYQLIPFTAQVYLRGPATYYIVVIGDTGGGTSKINTHILGSGLAAKQVGQVYATGFTTIAALIATQRAAATPFITALGPMASLY